MTRPKAKHHERNRGVLSFRLLFVYVPLFFTFFEAHNSAEYSNGCGSKYLNGRAASVFPGPGIGCCRRGAVSNGGGRCGSFRRGTVIAIRCFDICGFIAPRIGFFIGRIIARVVGHSHEEDALICRQNHIRAVCTFPDFAASGEIQQKFSLVTIRIGQRQVSVGIGGIDNKSNILRLILKVTHQ